MNREDMIKMMTIADHYGYESQSRQLIEEMAELTKAINKAWRVVTMSKPQELTQEFVDKSVQCRNDVIEELADVEIMLEQMKYLMDCRVDVASVIKKKLDRQLERIADDR